MDEEDIRKHRGKEMRAFIMAAGEGTRMWPLSETRPKPLIPVVNRPIIGHILDALADSAFKKVGVLLGREGRRIVEHYGYEYRGMRIDYRYQEKRLGTGDAARYAEKYGDERILFINGDIVFDKEMIERIKDEKNAVMGVFREDTEKYGVLIGEKYLERIEEKREGSEGGWINAGIYVFEREIFDAIKKCTPSIRGETELTDAINILAGKKKVKIVRSEGYWNDIGTPWDILDANRDFLKDMKGEIQGEIEENVQIKGSVSVGKGTVIKSGTYIEGPVVIGENCSIGPNSYLRPYTVIGNNCHIGNSSEIKASMIMDGSKIPHFNYVGDSVIGENCNLGAGTKVANLRLDEKNIKVDLKGIYVDTGRRKLGVIMGDDVHTGINVSIYPGTMIGKGVRIGPGAQVHGKIKSHSVIM